MRRKRKFFQNFVINIDKESEVFMKKLVLILAVLFTTTLAFAEPWKGGEEIVEKFFKKGTYVKLIADDDVNYYYKSTIVTVNIDDDELQFRTIIPVQTFGGRDNNEPEFSIKKFKIESDDDGNIIITKK